MSALDKISRSWKNPAVVVSAVSVIIALFSVFAAVSSCSNSRRSADAAEKSAKAAAKSDSRAERLFGSQMRPLIQDRPIKFIQYPETKAGATILEVVNYSGFDAYSISFDLKYGTNQWIGEWMNARSDHLEKEAKKRPLTRQEKEELRRYRPKIIDKLESGQREEVIQGIWTGKLPGERLLEDTREKEMDIFVRTTWKNEKHNTFDRIRKYKLVCTVDGNGKSFTFIPQQTVSPEE